MYLTYYIYVVLSVLCLWTYGIRASPNRGWKYETGTDESEIELGKSQLQYEVIFILTIIL